MHNVGDNFDPVYIARQEGYNSGQLLGEQVGFQQGQQAGYDSGHKDGYAEGYTTGHDEAWNAAIARANAEILKQMEFTRQHVADKASMSQQLQEQQQLITQMTARLDEVERENGNLKKSNQGLRDVVTALKEANERLQTSVSELDEKLKNRTNEYTNQVFQYNRNLVFMNAVRSTLEDLTIGNGSQAKQVRQMFAQKYGDEVSSALSKGLIRVPPDQDESLAKTMPRTHNFILGLLSSVATNAPQHIRGQMMKQVSNHQDDEHFIGLHGDHHESDHPSDGPHP